MNKNSYSIKLAESLDKKIDDLAKEKGITKAELIRKALALYALVEEKTCNENRELAIIDNSEPENAKIKYLITSL